MPPIWSVAPVDQEPDALLSDWRIVEVSAGTRHFVGYDMRNRQGRVSSRIVRFDPAARKGVTKSGRVYLLQGDPGSEKKMDEDVLWTWTGWAEYNNVTSAREVTTQALAGE